MRRGPTLATLLVVALVIIGAAMTLAFDAGSAGRDLGLAVVSGGLVGGVLVLVERIVVSAADERSEGQSLIRQLSATKELEGIDLSGRTLRGLYLPGRRLLRANLAGADLRQSNLAFGNLRFAQLQGADLRGADLRGSTFEGADLTGAQLQGALVDDADLSSTMLDGADLTGVHFVDVRFQSTPFGTACLEGTRFDNTYLEGADLSRVRAGSISFGEVEYDAATSWPPGIEPPPSSTVIQMPISDMDYAGYLEFQQARATGTAPVAPPPDRP